MEKFKTVHIHTCIEARIPADVPIRSLGLGLAGSKIHNDCKTIEGAEILTWWVVDTVPCSSRYVTCSQCKKIAPVASDAVVLDGKPLCIFCSAEFAHGDLPTKRTPEDLKAQLGFRK